MAWSSKAVTAAGGGDIFVAKFSGSGGCNNNRPVDFNCDGKTDILIENASTGQKGIWFMNGASITFGSVFVTVPTDWRMSGQ